MILVAVALLLNPGLDFSDFYIDKIIKQMFGCIVSPISVGSKVECGINVGPFVAVFDGALDGINGGSMVGLMEG